MGMLSGVLLLAGCAQLEPVSIVDSDADQVPDDVDQCLDTPAGHPVTRQGCGLFDRVLEVDFIPGNTALNSAARETLDTLIMQLREHPGVVLAIDSHTDNRGSASDNLELSKKRVMSVVRYLVVKGIAAQRLRPYGYGESRPVFSNATPEGRERNRRIEISVVSVSGA